MKVPNKKSALLICALSIMAVILTSTTYAAITTSQNLSSSGTIIVSANIGVYSDSDCTIPISTVTWGSINPSDSVTKTVYIKNTSSGITLTLDMTTSNWSPSNADGPLAITWNQEATKLAPGASIASTLTLTVSPTIADITDFSTQITIRGSQ